MPRYLFVVCAPDHRHDDQFGTALLSNHAAREHGQRIVRELKEGGYDPPGAVLYVQDESGQTLHSILF
jgi:hypothetical protein